MSHSPEVPLPREYIEANAAPEFEDALRHECGVFVVVDGSIDLATHAQLALERVKHRGHDSAGMAKVEDGQLMIHSAEGAPENLFIDAATTAQFRHGEMLIAGTRYATTGDTVGEHNRQPFYQAGRHGEVAFVMNGNIINTQELLAEITEWGFTANGNSDSEMVAYRIANGSGDTLEESVIDFVKTYQAGYSGAVMTPEQVIAFRDPYGIRPLQIARTEGGGWSFASETRVFRTLQYHPTRAVEPGEIMSVRPGERPMTIAHLPNEREASCLFEHIYFSGPESEMDDEYIGEVRDEMGRELAREDIARGTVPDVDIIFGIPESGVSMGEGYAEELIRNGYPVRYKRALIRTRGRSFNDPDPRRVIEAKFNPLPYVLKGKRVLVVDDSIVRGATGPYIVEMLRDAGATEVHFRSASPPLIDTCHLGVNISSREQLIANQHDSIEDIGRELHVNSLQYLSLEGTLKAAKKRFDEVCVGCMTGAYPMEIPDKTEEYLVTDDIAEIPDGLEMLFAPKPTTDRT